MKKFVLWALSVLVVFFFVRATVKDEVVVDEHIILWLIQAIVIPWAVYMTLQVFSLKTKVAVLETENRNHVDGGKKLEQSMEKFELEIKSELKEVRKELREIPLQLANMMKNNKP